MQTQHHALLSPAPGTQRQLVSLHFGTPNSGPKAYIQASLHADELPGMLVAHHLRLKLAALEAAGRLQGEVIVVPMANPIGLSQWLLHGHLGRFEAMSGENFNRHYPDQIEAAAAAAEPELTQDAAHNVRVLRRELQRAVAATPVETELQSLRRSLMALSCDADIVLDLHCDSQAAMHLYALTPQGDIAAELGALLGAEAVLLATESGDSPFDEACSRPWLQLQQQFAQAAIPLACFSATVELRGEADTDHRVAARDADAIVQFLRRRGVIAGDAGPLPAPRCTPTPLAGSEPVTAPHAGVVVFHAEPGARIEAGQVVADIVDADTGAVTAVRAQSGGVLYARIATRWATPGKRLAKIAGTSLARTGKLLSP